MYNCTCFAKSFSTHFTVFPMTHTCLHTQSRHSSAAGVTHLHLQLFLHATVHLSSLLPTASSPLLSCFVHPCPFTPGGFFISHTYIFFISYMRRKDKNVVYEIEATTLMHISIYQ